MSTPPDTDKPEVEIPLLTNIDIEPTMSLQVDAMYLNQAQTCFDLAVKRSHQIKRAVQKVERLNQKWEFIFEKHHGNKHAAYDDIEPVAIQMEGAEYDLGAAH